MVKLLKVLTKFQLKYKKNISWGSVNVSKSINCGSVKAFSKEIYNLFGWSIQKTSPTSQGTHHLPTLGKRRSLKNLSNKNRFSENLKIGWKSFRTRWWLKMSQKLPRSWSAIRKWGENQKTTQQSIEEKTHQTSQRYVPRTQYCNYFYHYCIFSIIPKNQTQVLNTRDALIILYLSFNYRIIMNVKLWCFLIL